tara:strand:+ start:4024 stop:4377 length:354 start_codon:yes stop_codon:yes gene_type:complete
MSETVHYIGRAIKVAAGLEGSKEYAMSVLRERDKKVEDYYKGNVIECLCDNYCEEFFFHPKTSNIYKIESKEFVDIYEDIIKAKQVGEGVIEYELKYYNGGAGFSECLEEAFDKLQS